MVFNHSLTYGKKFGSWRENAIILVRIFEEVRLVLKLEFLISFCILMIYKYLPTYDENFESGTHEVKIGLFLSEYLKGSYWS